MQIVYKACGQYFDDMRDALKHEKNIECLKSIYFALVDDNFFEKYTPQPHLPEVSFNLIRSKYLTHIDYRLKYCTNNSYYSLNSYSHIKLKRRGNKLLFIKYDEDIKTRYCGYIDIEKYLPLYISRELKLKELI